MPAPPTKKKQQTFGASLPSVTVVAQPSQAPVKTVSPTMAELIKLPMEDRPFVEVTALKSDQWEPFQKIRLPQGDFTPVRLTPWVLCQINAGILKRK